MNADVKNRLSWIEKRLGQLGVDIRQSQEHCGMEYYLELLSKEEIMTRKFLSEDRNIPTPPTTISPEAREVALKEKNDREGKHPLDWKLTGHYVQQLLDAQRSKYKEYKPNDPEFKWDDDFGWLHEGTLIAINDIRQQLSSLQVIMEGLAKDVEKQIGILDEEIDTGGSERQWIIAAYLKTSLLPCQQWLTFNPETKPV